MAYNKAKGDRRMEYDLRAIGKRIADLRNFHGMTQQALGDELGVTAKQIGRIEYGTSSLVPKNYLKISELFSVSLDYLFTGELEKPIDACVQKFLEQASRNQQEAVWKFLREITREET